MQIKHGDFFSGVNMWARAADLAGMQSVFAAEINKDRLKVTARKRKRKINLQFPPVKRRNSCKH